jgi:hypothetical protein
MYNDYKNEETRTLLDLIGLFFIIAPSVFLMFGDQQTKYSLLLGSHAVALLFGGISLSYPVYRIAGIVALVLAVLPHTYQYVMALPRWMVVGLVGLLFITLGIFLLLKRKETE